MVRVCTFGDDALGDLDAVGVAEAIRAGSVSADEVVQAAIARTEKAQPELNGLAYEAFDQAVERARAPRPFGGFFFDGVPTFIKDNVAVGGWPTMQGTDAWTPRPMPADGNFARLYRATGLIPLGKTQLSEFGFSASAEHPRIGPVRNPWDTTVTAGASSSGAGAFVAAGVVPIAHANDGGGSIRIPASCNGLVGLKPTRGRLPVDREARMPLQIVANGVLTRSVRDTAAFYREAEKIYRNPRLPAIGDVTVADARRLRIAVCTSSIGRDASAEMRDLTLAVATELEQLGHRVTMIGNPVPDRFLDDFLLYWAFLAFALVRGGKHTFGPSFDRAKLDNLTLGLDRLAARSLHRVPGAIARLAASRRIPARLARDYDVVLTPTLARVTPPIGYLDPTADYDQIISRLIDWVSFTPLQNATGTPAISLPLARSVDGLPVGMMFGSASGEEATLLALAYELEQAIGWAQIS